MPFKYYINNTLVDNPLNDLSLVTKIHRDDSISGMVITQDAVLQWDKDNEPVSGTASAYVLLKDMYDLSLCSEATIDIYDQVSDTETRLKHKGVIKIVQLEFAEQEQIVSTRIQDNSYYSYINNNKDLKVDLRAVLTKNKLELAPLDFYTVDMFNGCDGGFGGAAIGAYYKGYLITDVFSFVISAITDNKVSFQSDYLTSLTHPLMLFKGQSLFSSFTIYPSAQVPVFEISFQDIFNELSALYNLYYYFDTTDRENPILRVEPYEQTFTAATGFEIINPLKIKTTVDLNTLYAKVVVGSNVTVDGLDCNLGGVYTMSEAISYYGFKQEEFFPLGQCNTGAEYRIVNNWVISNNVIQDCVVGASESFLDNYILVECDAVDTGLLTANAFPYGQPAAPFLYNVGLNNMAKLQRHSVQFETEFGNFLGFGSLAFRALWGDDPSQDITYVTAPASHPNFITPGGLTVPVLYPNTTTQGGFNGSGNYNGATGQYTVTQDGDYSFHKQIHVEVGGLADSDYFEIGIRITHYDSGLVQKTATSGGTYAYYNGIFYADATLVTNAVVGDIIEAVYVITYFPNQTGPSTIPRTVTVIWDSFFECNGTPEGGVTVSSGNQSIRKLLHEMEYPVSETEWLPVLANPTGMIPFTKDGVTRYGWIKEIVRSDQTGIANIKLMSSNATA